MTRRHAEPLYQEALQAARAGDPTRARALLVEAHALDARHVGVRNALGVLRLEQGDAQGAVAVLKPLAKELPAAAPILLNLGNALVAAQRSADAIAPLRKASQLDARNPLVWYGYGRALQLAGRAVDAAEAYARVVALDPTHVEAHSNRSAALMFAGAYDNADTAAQEALALDPQHAGAHFNRAMTLLARGQWAEGWAEYEWRERTTLLDGMRRVWTRPRWEGESLLMRTVLVHAEQGFGDTLQCVRWIAPLRMRGARVVLVVPAPLVTLLRASDVADEVLAFGEALPAHDLQAPLTALAHRLPLHTDGDVMGDGSAYLRPASTLSPSLATWVDTLPAQGPRIGLVWAGSGTHVNDMHRSIPLGVFEPLLKRTDVTWVSLQAGERAADLAALPRRLAVHDAAPLLTSFHDTAQLLQHLDGVVTVDSAVAHLAGALGTRCWVLLPRIGLDWRWAAEHDGARWYASVSSIRQDSPGGWGAVMPALHAVLDAFPGAAPARR